MREKESLFQSILRGFLTVYFYDTGHSYSVEIHMHLFFSKYILLLIYTSTFQKQSII